MSALGRHVAAGKLCMFLALGWAFLGWVLLHGLIEAGPLVAQDLSWVRGAMEDSQKNVRKNLSAWQYDPRVAANNDDAALNGLCVVNPDRMWAVGDRGLILSSTDGGRSWYAQQSDTTLNLYDVAFIDERNGVAVGGTIQPMSQTSVGIILITNDAGTTWRAISAISRAPLPRLIGIAYEPGGAMRVWGDYSSAHLTGIFESADRGQSWLPTPSNLGHIQAIAGAKHGMQLAIDRAGRLGQIPLNPNRPLIQLATPTAPIHLVAHTGQQWLALGSAGTLAVSRDGQQWSDQSLPLSPAARAVCSFQCLAIQDQNIWVGGSPGTLLLHSADGGNSWRKVETGQPWPVQAIQFVDRHRGWLVTSAGSILATRDGGNSWFQQRHTVKRLGFQAVCLTDNHIPWPALADAGWQAGQASSLLVLHRMRGEDVVDFAPDAGSCVQTLGTQIGMAQSIMPSHWPVSSPSDYTRMLVTSNQATSPQSMALGLPRLEDYLAVQLRLGRPSALLVDNGPAQDKLPGGMTDPSLRALAAASSDSPQTTWMSEELHLTPWKVSKLFTVSQVERADFTITQDQLLRDSGLSISDVLAPIEGWQGKALQNTSLRCLQLTGGSHSARQSLLASTDRHPDAKRPVDLAKVGNLQLLMGRVHRQRAWQTLAPNALNAEESLESWLKKVDVVTESTPRTEVGQAMVRLAGDCWNASQWERWIEVVDRLAKQSKLTDWARWGSLTILRHAASDERLAWQLAQASTSVTGRPDVAQAKVKLASPLESDPFETRAPVRTTETDSSDSTIQLVSAEESIDTAHAYQVSQLRQAVSEFNRLLEFDRAITARPDVVLAHFARRRALAELAKDPTADAGAMQLLNNSSQLAGWQQAAQQESQLASGKLTAAAWTAHARRTSEPPALDGKPSEACWKAASKIELTSPFDDSQVANNLAQVRFAYDAEFLYVLCECAELGPAVKDARSESANPRRYDMELSGTDHMVLNFDTDRDYVSASELAVNQFGHTYDRCCQSALWNPRWYVAVDRTQRGWTAEYAVRLSDLTCLPVQPGRVWAISAFRYLPGGEVLSWSQLRSYTPRQQGNGLLVFEP